MSLVSKHIAPHRVAFVNSVLLGFGLASLTFIQLASGRNAFRTFTSKNYGYSVQYPKGWYLDPTRVADTLDIDNFLPSNAVRAVHLPPNGSKISLMPLNAVHGREVPQTLEDWIKIDSRHRAGATKETIEVNVRLGKLSVIEVKSYCCAVAPFLEFVNWYFIYEGRTFKAVLAYWKGDPKVDNLRQTLQQIVVSLRLRASATALPAPQ